MRTRTRPGTTGGITGDAVSDAPVLTARSISKSYGALRALDDIEITVAPGRVHAIVGENGAGKSTLAKILAGLELPTSGTMALDGRPYSPTDRADARAAGITMVPQQLSLVGELTLVENLLLTGSRRILSRRSARAVLVETLERAGVAVDIDVPTSRLSQAHRQLGEIVVALAEGARTLILDEPTASLGPLEVGGLFDHLRSLTELGTALVLITHRLEEVRRIADDVTVLSHGVDVHTGSAAGLEPRRIAEMMVGELADPPERAPRPRGPVVLRASRVSTSGGRDAPLRGIDLDLHAAEIVGVAGVAGSGQNALVDVLAGFIVPTEGTVTVDGEPGTAVQLLQRGVAWIPEERSEAVVPGMSVGENLDLYSRARTPGRRRGPARPARLSPPARRTADPSGAATSTALLTAFDVRPGLPDMPASGLSGGNQQKLLAARELGRVGTRTDGADGQSSTAEEVPRVVLAYGPTQGLDLRAAQAIRQRLVALAERGAALLVASHDLDEVRAIADRVVVMFDGRIVADLPADLATPQRVGEAMAGIVPGRADPPAADPGAMEAPR